MLKKSFLTAMTLFAFAAATFAADIVRLDLNYYCRGQLKLLSKLPDGITMSARKNYSQKKFANICLYTVSIDVGKVQDFEFEIEVVDTEGKKRVKLDPSLSPSGKLAVECLEFEVGDEISTLVPCKITKWTSMIKGAVLVKQGDKITIKGKFKKVETPAADGSAAK